jgi:glycosyltransferase involved in cell wall biosynthesis
MEVILVNDGSPDLCPQKCDQWAARDNRIQVIHKENGGLSDARNAGIDIAQGDHLTFVDSDDWLADNTLAPLLDMMVDADLLEYSIHQRLTLPDSTYTDMNDYWLHGQAYLHTYACNKIYRRSLFDNVRFPRGKVFEDAWTLPLLLRQCHKVMTTSRGFYHYQWNPEGITAKADGHQLAMLLEAHLTNGMPVNDTYYLHLLNIQIDVCERLNVPVTLPFRRVHYGHLYGIQKLKAAANNILRINALCKIVHFIHLFKKPSRW